MTVCRDVKGWTEIRVLNKTQKSVVFCLSESDCCDCRPPGLARPGSPFGSAQGRLGAVPT